MLAFVPLSFGQDCPDGTQYGRVVTSSTLGAKASDLSVIMGDCKSCLSIAALAYSADTFGLLCQGFQRVDQ